MGAGGGADQFARAITHIMEKSVGVRMPVSNVTGAAGNAGLANITNAAPDGHTIGVLTGQTAATWAAKGARFSPDDFAYIAIVQKTPSMYVVANNSPYKTYQDLLDISKKSPNTLKVGTSGYDTLDALAVKYLMSVGYPMLNVPYRSAAERYMAPLGGHVDVIFEDPSGVSQFFASGQLRPIVVFGKKRHPAFPAVPTSYEFGHQIDLPNWRAFVIQKNTPKPIVEYLNGVIKQAVQTKEWRAFCERTYTCTAIRSPEESKQFVQDFVHGLNQSRAADAKQNSFKQKR